MIKQIDCEGYNVKKLYTIALYISIPLLFILSHLYQLCRNANVFDPSKQWLSIIPSVILLFLCVFFTLLTLCSSKYYNHLIVKAYLIIAVVFFLISLVSLNISYLRTSFISRILTWSFGNNCLIFNGLALAYYTVLLICSLIQSKGRIQNEN